MAAPRTLFTKEEQRCVVCYYARTLCKVLKFTHGYVLSLGAILFLGGVYINGQKCSGKIT